ncbi:NlpC/P60 family protein [Streptomyces sp. NPDC007088]|uniref:C40 family peptidase n=1 Tax=Streptomyces sp. NPDC007088 TaxID=3364773 RepID=UPI0036BE3A8F
MASHRRPASLGPDRGARVTALTAAAAATAAALAASPASAEPAPTRETARAGVDRLLTEAERATEAYNKAEERARRLRDRLNSTTDAVARAQERVNTMRGMLGSLATAQYRAGRIDPTLALLLSSDPDDYLAGAALLERIGAVRSGQLDALEEARRALAQDRAQARRTLAALERGRADVARHKRTVEARLSAARRLLGSLTERQRADFRRGSRAGSADRADLPGADAVASGRAAAAVAAARRALGSPYVWGASGPSSFDCSGLMQWAWGQAGVGLPRTSQAQAHAGRRVPLSQALPGDLVAYRADASHIGMYVGGGQVIHAPYPGAPVRRDPVGMMPVSSVTRP